MATINFYLKDADKKNMHPVILVYQDKGEKVKHATKLKVRKEEWKNQRVFTTDKTRLKEVKQINAILEDLKNEFEEIERQALFNRVELTPAEVLAIYKEKHAPVVPTTTGAKTNPFKALYKQFIESNKATKSKATINSYGDTLAKLELFEAMKGEKVWLERIDQAFYQRFLNFLILDMQYLNNTVGKHIKTLKVFINYLSDNNLLPNPIEVRKFKVLREEPDVIHLTEEELLAIYHCKNLTQEQEWAKDNFCFSCFTGLRYSDNIKVDRSHIKDNMIEIRTTKTKKAIFIPLNPFAKEIIKKYDNPNSNRPLPPVMHNVTANALLKEIAKAAGLNEQVRLERFSGSRRIVEYKTKWQLVCTHTARRTFITLSIEKGMQSEVIMDVTGISSHKIFKRYLNITNKTRFVQMHDAWGTLGAKLTG